jgi:hypothetical protein
MPFAVESPSDLFLEELPVQECATFFPLGFAVELSTNSKAVMAAARLSWGRFPEGQAGPPLTLCITETERFDDERLPAAPKFRTHGHLMSIVADARNHVVCDFSRGCAFGWVTQRVAEQTDFLRFHFLEGPVMTMLVAAHLAPIHGALVSRNGVGVALCGESLAGKSTLAYACARRGWTFVTDDATYLLRDQIRNRAGFRAVGNPYSARFREHARSLFSELENCRATAKLNGAPGMEIATSELPVATAGGASVDHLVFLRRSGAGSARIERFAATRALQWLEGEVLYGPAEAQRSQQESYRRLVDGAGI